MEWQQKFINITTRGLHILAAHTFVHRKSQLHPQMFRMVHCCTVIVIHNNFNKVNKYILNILYRELRKCTFWSTYLSVNEDEAV